MLNIFERDWPKFDQENFFLNYLSVDWENNLIHVPLKNFPSKN